MAISSIGYLKQLDAQQMKKAVQKEETDYYTAACASIAKQMEERRITEDTSTEERVLRSNGRVEVMPGSRLKAHLSGEDDKVPYGYLAKDGIIEYNGVTFVCDYNHNRLCLGDTTNKEECITIPLEDGGSLVVNRDNVGALAKAIGMFSPEDANRIMRALHQDTKARQMLEEIKEEENSVGKMLEV